MTPKEKAEKYKAEVEAKWKAKGVEYRRVKAEWDALGEEMAAAGRAVNDRFQEEIDALKASIGKSS